MTYLLRNQGDCVSDVAVSGLAISADKVSRFDSASIGRKMVGHPANSRHGDHCNMSGTCRGASHHLDRSLAKEKRCSIEESYLPSSRRLLVSPIGIVVATATVMFVAA